jgi:hypothetical protein
MLGHHIADAPCVPVECHGETGGAGFAPDLHAGWALVHHDWGARQRESSRRPRRVSGLIEAARGLARRLLQLVLRASVAVAFVRSTSHD